MIPSRQTEPPRRNVQKYFASIQRSLESLHVTGDRDDLVVIHGNLSPSSVSSKHCDTRALADDDESRDLRSPSHMNAHDVAIRLDGVLVKLKL